MTTAAELNEIAASLAKATANFDRLVAVEGKKVGDAFGRTYATAAREQIADKDHEIQRQTDLVAELRRQMEPLEFRHDEYRRMKSALNELRHRTVRVPENRFTQFGTAELLRILDEALRPATNPDADQAFASTAQQRESQ